ncbi:hypothetical protein GCM10007424_01280 [Flavobacterium suaedae]|uniref:ATP-binding protein n=1 Tax=Flavobacterium suaedae TaxID=1767027 RepID=A0ABQ1JFE5_9FLAO|nr:hypothetical protein [Flavobacterium suaedae]GGB65116.1 hypothetical protein GCM10007424_01280 [Flavobacterium suaedae]
MQIDILGKVREKRLAYSNTLLPLFEAIVNSIHAIEEESSTKPGIIKVELIRSYQGKLELDSKEENINLITDFIITDNGIGFNEQNYESFNFAHSTYKIDKGGKGIGRITWLRAFERAKIESVFRHNGIFQKRTFSFEQTKKGIENHKLEDLEESNPNRYTKVHLNNLKEDYRKWCNTKSEDIALKIIEHCFSYFLDTENCPRILIVDGDDEIVVNDLFGLYTKKSIIKSDITINKNSFQLDIVKLYSPKPDNKIHFRAHKREVYNQKISDYIPEIQKFFIDNNNELFSICVYVSGNFLDEKVNEERTEIGFSKQNSLFPDEVTEEEITTKIIDVVRENFKDYIDELSANRVNRVREFVKDHPRYRYLLKYKPEELRHIPSQLSDSKLEIELFKVQQKLELEVLSETEQILSNIENSDSENIFADELYNKILEVGNSKLAEYILHRKKILELLEVQLRKSNEGKYSKEDAVHQLIFPLRKTSDDVKLEEHNLWVIDERLSFHDYLASDKTFNSIESIASKSTKETDLIVFNKPHILNEDEKPYSSIVIVEFKRPMRNDYTDSENPISQINTYARELLANKVLDKYDRPFDLRDGIPLYAYIICDLTNKMRQFAEDQSFTKFPDNDGYFSFNRNYNLYIEIISFDKLIKDSKKRNKVLFEKLNLPTA